RRHGHPRLPGLQSRLPAARAALLPAGHPPQDPLPGDRRPAPGAGHEPQHPGLRCVHHRPAALLHRYIVLLPAVQQPAVPRGREDAAVDPQRRRRSARAGRYPPHAHLPEWLRPARTHPTGGPPGIPGAAGRLLAALRAGPHPAVSPSRIRNMNLYLRMLWVLIASKWKPTMTVEALQNALELRVLPNDLDLNLHMNNGRFLTICDLSRVDLFIRTGLAALMVQNKWAPIISRHTMDYRRPLSPFQKYTVTMSIDRWDEK